MQAGTRPRTPDPFVHQVAQGLGEAASASRPAGIVVIAALPGPRREVAFKVGSVIAICKKCWAVAEARRAFRAPSGCHRV